MNVLELANELDMMFGNPLGPKRYELIKEAVSELRRLQKENEELKKAQKK